MKELELLDQASGLRVLFTGEKIIDVYRYVRALGKPTKDATLSVQLMDTETFDGGVVAAAKHAQSFARVDVRVGGHLYRKIRYIAPEHMKKLFEVYEHNGSCLHYVRDYDVYDIVVVFDYGHGMATPEFIERVQNEAKYLAVNVQTNSENYGFNLATKYTRADYLCVDEPEARLATQNRDGPIEDSLRAIRQIAQKVCITTGKNGAIGADSGQGHAQLPAFTETIIDTVGAGDAFFAITALIAPFADMQSLLRIGNAAGALKAQSIGHRQPVTKDALTQYLQGLSR